MRNRKNNKVDNVTRSNISDRFSETSSSSDSSDSTDNSDAEDDSRQGGSGGGGNEGGRLDIEMDCIHQQNAETSLITGKKTSMKGVAERSSVFPSENFTVISQILEELPDNSHKRNAWNALKRIDYIGLKPATSLSRYENNKGK